MALRDEPAGRRFGMQDQALFAVLSGDTNAMHVDPVAARRTAAGSPAVHGAHALIWALEHLVPRFGGEVAGFTAQFNRFILLDVVVTLRVVSQDDATLEAEILADGTPAVAIQLVARPQEAARGVPDGARRLDAGAEPMGSVDLVFEEVAGLGGSVAGMRGAGDAARRLATSDAPLPPALVAGLMAASRLVGIVCPGTHSILSRVQLDFDAACDGPALRYAVVDADERFRRVVMAVVGFGLRGTVTAYMRQPPVQQPGIESLRPLVGGSAFAGSRALIVGGSRGLGALTAKLLALGGAEVTITYATGADDAARTAAEITAAGMGCSVTRFDARRGVADQLSGLDPRTTHAYYYATGRIFGQGAGLFSPSVLADHVEVYATGFHALCSFLSTHCTGGVSVLYPSSVAVEQRPRGMTEYAMAKLGGEALCRDLDRWLPGIATTIVRFPRVLTDQTATTSPVRAEDAVAILLPVLGGMHAS